MKRLLTTLAATAVAAAITIPAVAQGGGTSDRLTTFTACLAAHGVNVPAGLDGVALKQWIAARQDDSTVAAAINACEPPRDDQKADHIASCLKAHGVDVPDDPRALKDQVAELSQTAAGRAALGACHIDVGDKPDCGGGKPAPPADYPSEKRRD